MDLKKLLKRVFYNLYKLVVFFLWMLPDNLQGASAALINSTDLEEPFNRIGAGAGASHSLITCEQVEELKTAATNGNAAAQMSLGQMYEQGNGVMEDFNQAVFWYKKAAEQGKKEAQFMLGTHYFFGGRLSLNIKESAKWFERAALQGHTEAQANFGRMLEIGDSIPVDKSKAAEFYQAAASKGNVMAQYQLAQMYYEGRGIARNVELSKHWHHQAALQDHTPSQYRLGMLLLKEHKEAEAAIWFQRCSVRSDWSKAQYRLGQLYEKGLGVPQNYGQALAYYNRGREFSHSKSCYRLGLLHEEGLNIGGVVIPRSDIEAARFYQEAIECIYGENKWEAYYRLGRMYEEGRGVTQDDNKAATLYREAALWGHTQAQESLNRLHAEGRGLTTWEWVTSNCSIM